MTNEPVREDATDIRPAGACARCQAAPQSTAPHARQARHETVPVFSLARRQGSAGGGSGARVTPAVGRGCGVPQACAGTEPVLSPDRCGRVGAIGVAAPAPLRDRLDVPVLGVTRPAGLRRDALPRPLQRREHDALPGPAVGDKWRATLRRGAASLTETVGRAPFEQCGRRAGEGAR
ncbi:DUF6380 family protein [Streptomyces africanus]|uniref:DUF6380 family protein n=1 Tax=Streptomyces africanus TaxID=231024 RepID=UPI000A39FE75|nr:DUF6380 family protein [Streptomyces africanus]